MTMKYSRKHSQNSFLVLMNLVPGQIPLISAGSGRIVLRSNGSAAIFSELSSTYPLKLLSPRVDREGVAIVYMLTYGGGLVGGDTIQLSVDVGPSTVLVLLSQVLFLFFL
jgi:urease accessory protein